MSIPLEDNFADIIGKAQRGLNISDSQLAEQAGISPAAVQSLRSGQYEAAAAAAVAPVLKLNARALAELATNAYTPAPIDPLPGLAQFNTPFGEMTVNSYLVWDRDSRDAAAFDTGGDCTEMFHQIQAERLAVRYIFLTHTHGDHIFDLDRLIHFTGTPAYVSDREPLEGAESFSYGRQFHVGRLTIATRLTWGHSKGGLTYVIAGLPHPVAIVGDALFAGSMGGGMASYDAAIRTNREEIFTLPDDTILCPGHGPMSTLAEEKAHNPFFSTTP